MTYERAPTMMQANTRVTPNEGRFECPYKCPIRFVGAREWVLNPHGVGPNGENWCPGSNHLLPPDKRNPAVPR